VNRIRAASEAVRDEARRLPHARLGLSAAELDRHAVNVLTHKSSRISPVSTPQCCYQHWNVDAYPLPEPNILDG